MMGILIHMYQLAIGSDKFRRLNVGKGISYNEYDDKDHPLKWIPTNDTTLQKLSEFVMYEFSIGMNIMDLLHEEIQAAADRKETTFTKPILVADNEILEAEKTIMTHYNEIVPDSQLKADRNGALNTIARKTLYEFASLSCQTVKKMTKESPEPIKRQVDSRRGWFFYKKSANDIIADTYKLYRHCAQEWCEAVKGLTRMDAAVVTWKEIENTSGERFVQAIVDKLGSGMQRNAMNVSVAEFIADMLAWAYTKKEAIEMLTTLAGKEAWQNITDVVIVQNQVENRIKVTKAIEDTITDMQRTQKRGTPSPNYKTVDGWFDYDVVMNVAKNALKQWTVFSEYQPLMQASDHPWYKWITDKPAWLQRQGWKTLEPAALTQRMETFSNKIMAHRPNKVEPDAFLEHIGEFLRGFNKDILEDSEWPGRATTAYHQWNACAEDEELLGVEHPLSWADASEHIRKIVEMLRASKKDSETDTPGLVPFVENMIKVAAYKVEVTPKTIQTTPMSFTRAAMGRMLGGGTNECKWVSYCDENTRLLNETTERLKAAQDGLETCTKNRDYEKEQLLKQLKEARQELGILQKERLVHGSVVPRSHARRQAAENRYQVVYVKARTARRRSSGRPAVPRSHASRRSSPGRGCRWRTNDCRMASVRSSAARSPTRSRSEQRRWYAVSQWAARQMRARCIHGRRWCRSTEASTGKRARIRGSRRRTSMRSMSSSSPRSTDRTHSRHRSRPHVRQLVAHGAHTAVAFDVAAAQTVHGGMAGQNLPARRATLFPFFLSVCVYVPPHARAKKKTTTRKQQRRRITTSPRSVCFSTSL